MEFKEAKKEDEDFRDQQVDWRNKTWVLYLIIFRKNSLSKRLQNCFKKKETKILN